MNCSDYADDASCHLWINGSVLEALSDLNSTSSYSSLLPPHWLREQLPPGGFYVAVGVIFSVFCALNNVCAFLVVVVFVRLETCR